VPLAPLRTLLARAEDRRGFTLVETLVAMLTGVVVTGALFTILDFSVKQSSRLSQVAQATQISRTAMTHVVDELHSACLSPGFVPVQAGSTPSKLIFITGYSEEAEIPFKSVRREEVEYVVTGGKGYLKDKGATAATEPSFREYTWGTAATTILAENVSPYEGKETIPIFKYYKYAQKSATGTGEAAATLEEVPVTTELKAAEAAKVASVSISFRTAPYKKETKLTAASEAGTFADLSTQTTFAFSAPNSETTISAAPCE
jgi:type II secretory pathway pseudopilin PulG